MIQNKRTGLIRVWHNVTDSVNIAHVGLYKGGIAPCARIHEQRVAKSAVIRGALRLSAALCCYCVVLNRNAKSSWFLNWNLTQSTLKLCCNTASPFFPPLFVAKQDFLVEFDLKEVFGASIRVTIVQQASFVRRPLSTSACASVRSFYKQT